MQWTEKVEFTKMAIDPLSCSSSSPPPSTRWFSLVCKTVSFFFFTMHLARLLKRKIIGMEMDTLGVFFFSNMDTRKQCTETFAESWACLPWAKEHPVVFVMRNRSLVLGAGMQDQPLHRSCVLSGAMWLERCIALGASCRGQRKGISLETAWRRRAFQLPCPSSKRWHEQRSSRVEVKGGNIKTDWFPLRIVGMGRENECFSRPFQGL